MTPRLPFRVTVFIVIVVFSVVFIIQEYSEENFVVQRSNKIMRRILHFDNNNNSSSSNNEKAANIYEDIPLLPENLADFYFGDETLQNHKPANFNKTCAKFPSDVFNLKFQSDIWQLLKTKRGTFALFNAYLDDRASNPEGALIRILGVYDMRPNDTTDTFFCQYWYRDSKQPIIVKAESPIRIWIQGWGGNNEGLFNSYLVSCKIDLSDDNNVPESVSLVEQPCDNATNNLKVIYNKPSGDGDKEDFVVCVKGLNFPFEDKTERLVEWIELLKILGADKIHFYIFSVHPNIHRLLDYYKKRGFVETTHLTLAGDVSNTLQLQSQYLKKKVMQRRLQEVIPYNDCLYKHLYEYKYMVLHDTDEVIIPAKGTWNDLMAQAVDPKKSRATYVARNVYFLDSFEHDHHWFEGIPKFMHMLQHVYRAANYTGKGAYVKGFHDTDKIVSQHNHFPFKCNGNCASTEIDLKLAHLQHYRSDCVKDVKNCAELKKDSVMDARIWNYKDELIANSVQVLKDLDLLKD